MRIKLVKATMLKGAPGVQFQAGSTAEVNPDIAREWISKGYAMPDVIKAEPEKAVIEPEEKRTAAAKPAVKTTAKK